MSSHKTKQAFLTLLSRGKLVYFSLIFFCFCYPTHATNTTHHFVKNINYFKLYNKKPYKQIHYKNNKRVAAQSGDYITLNAQEYLHPLLLKSKISWVQRKERGLHLDKISDTEVGFYIPYLKQKKKFILNLIVNHQYSKQLVAKVVIHATPSSDTANRCTNGHEMFLVAHQDDDIIFMSPDLAQKIEEGICITTVFLTAGDAGRDRVYWQSRENGAQAAYGKMAEDNNWFADPVSINARQLSTVVLSKDQRIRLVFMRLPDGFPDGSRVEGSLQQLWEGTITDLQPLDSLASYTRDDLINTLAEAMAFYDVQAINFHDAEDVNNRDHSDHTFAGKFALAASELYEISPDQLTQYVGYFSSELEQNITSEQLTQKIDVFKAYAQFDSSVNININPANGISTPYRVSWLPRQYKVGQAEAAAPPPVNIINSGSITGANGRCIDITNANQENGATVQYFDCTPNVVPQQQWELLSTGQLRSANNKCLDVKGPLNAIDVPLEMWECQDTPTQQWQLTDNNEVINTTSELCITLENGMTANSTILELATCDGSLTQMWFF